MDACEECGGHDGVEWYPEAGDICRECTARRERARIEREDEAERERERNDLLSGKAGDY